MKGGAPETGSEDLDRIIEAVQSCLYQSAKEFQPEKDYFNLRGQDNIVRYLPTGTVVIRVHEEDSLFEILARAAAGRIAGCKVIISLQPDTEGSIGGSLDSPWGRELIRGSKVLVQSDRDLVKTIPDVDLIRYAAPDRVPLDVFTAAAGHGVHVARDPVMMEGRLELLHYLKEQSISSNYHRYGNLGEREE